MIKGPFLIKIYEQIFYTFLSVFWGDDLTVTQKKVNFVGFYLDL